MQKKLPTSCARQRPFGICHAPASVTDVAVCPISILPATQHVLFPAERKLIRCITEDDPDAEEALAELRSDLDLLKDAQRRSEMDATDAILAAEIEDSEREQKLQEMDLEETEDEERTADKTGLPEAVDEVKQPGATDMDMDVKHPGQPEDTGPELKQPENKQPVHNMPVCEMPKVKQPELKQLGGKMPVYKMPEITQPEPNLLKRESAEDIKAVQSDTEMAGGEDQGHPPLLHHRSIYATLPRRKKPHAVSFVPPPHLLS
jgi:hypothetical protein